MHACQYDQKYLLLITELKWYQVFTQKRSFRPQIAAVIEIICIRYNIVTAMVRISSFVGGNNETLLA